MLSKAKKKFSLGVTAFTTALSLTAVGGAPAYAAQPGESSNWSAEMAGGGQVNTVNGYTEARDPNGNLVQVWEDDNTQIHVSYNNGGDYVFTNIGAVVSNAQVIWTGFGWRIFAVEAATSVVYYAGFQVNSDGTLTLGDWEAIPGNVRTNVPISVTALQLADNGGNPQEEWMLSWTGTDGQVNVQYHQRTEAMQGQGYFDDPVQIPGGTSTSYHPGIAFNMETGVIVVTWAQASDRNAYMAVQQYGSPNWSSWQMVGGAGLNAASGPEIAFQNFSGFTHGYSGIIYRAQGKTLDRTYLYFTSSWENSSHDFGSNPWASESTGWQTTTDPALSSNGGVIYVAAADTGYSYWWKEMAAF